MTRLALLSDVHGNLTALEAVLADVEEAGGVDGYRVVGDLAAFGPEPAEVVARLTALPGVAFVRGNTDRYVLTGDLPAAAVEAVQRDPRQLRRVADSAATFGWTRGMLTAAGRLDALDGLPLEHRETLPDRTRLLCVHASPGRDDGPGIAVAQTDEELAALLDDAGADLVVTGHTHVPVERALEGVRAVNLGAVGLPPAGETAARYAILDASDDGHTLHRRAVEYDHGAVVEALLRVRPPALEYILGHFARG